MCLKNHSGLLKRGSYSLVVAGELWHHYDSNMENEHERSDDQTQTSG